MEKVILITGATGQQGRAIIERLSGISNIHLLGLTRNASSEASCRLTKKYPSLTLISGNLNNADAIFRASDRPIWGVFSVSPAMVSGLNPAEEERQGKQLIDAAIANGVKHFLLSSVDRNGAQSDNNETNVPHFQSKFRLEKYLQHQASSAPFKESRMVYTILRLPFFMENIAPTFTGRIVATAWKLALHPAKKMQLISVKDIARYVAKAFDDGKLANEAVSISGDALTFNEANALYHKNFKESIPMTYEFPVKVLLRWMSELSVMMAWFNKVGCDADIPLLREQDGELMDFQTWLNTSYIEN